MSEKKKYLVSGEEVSKAEYAAYFGKIASEGRGSKEHLMLRLRALKLISDVYQHKHKKPLFDAVRSQPELFLVDEFREFVADMLEGKQVSAEKTHRWETVRQVAKIRACVEYYTNMGINSSYVGKRGVNAVELVAQRLEVSEGQVNKALSKEIDYSGCSAYFGDSQLLSWDGVIIFILNGFRVPESEDCIQVLEDRLKALTEDQYRVIRKFSEGYNARQLKKIHPKTQKELEKVKETLNQRENYAEVKAMQVREISL